MGFSELFKGQRWRKRTGVPHLQSISKQHNLNTAGTGIIAMRNSIDNCLPHHFRRDFVGDRNLCTFSTSTNSKVNFRENKVNCLIDKIKGPALVYLI